MQKETETETETETDTETEKTIYTHSTIISRGIVIPVNSIL